MVISKRSFKTLSASLTIPVLLLSAQPVMAAEVEMGRAGVSVDDQLSVDQADFEQYLQELNRARTETEAYSALENYLGENEAKEAIRQNSPATMTSYRGAGTFTTCVKNKATDDVKDAFNINLVTAAIGQKDYAKAAREAAKYLAKQGVKRNAAVLAGLFAYWGWQCRGEW